MAVPSLVVLVVLTAIEHYSGHCGRTSVPTHGEVAHPAAATASRLACAASRTPPRRGASWEGFGSLGEQCPLQLTARPADAVIGNGLLTAEAHGVALRSMAHPGTTDGEPVLGRDRQPPDMQHVARTTQDNRGVHIDAGTPNRACCVAAKRVGDKRVGEEWERAGRSWYGAIRDPQLPAILADFARRTAMNGATPSAAAELPGAKAADPAPAVPSATSPAS